jgi:hypothetical protein
LQNYKNKEDETATSGLVVPLLPFGMPKYDAGERFDLRSPYADDGWVDPDETGEELRIDIQVFLLLLLSRAAGVCQPIRR